jgi:hypothetical protein
MSRFLLVDRTAVVPDIAIRPGVEFKPVEGDGLLAEGNLGEVGPRVGDRRIAFQSGETGILCFL